jgi:predicted Rossmann fold flavoprotein
MTGVKKSKKPANKHPIIVIGGGPAGMTAALTAARYYGSVMLFDKNPQPGKKLLSIPNTSLFVSEELPLDKTARAFGEKENFVKLALKGFGWKQLQEHLAQMGIKVTTNGYNHVMVPVEIASELPSRLKGAAESAGAVVKKSSRVSDVLFSNNAATGVVVNAVEYAASAVIIASGSFSSPGCGSTKDGYEFARKAGHTVIPLHPALVGLETYEKHGKLLTDVEFADCRIEVELDGRGQLTDRGGLKFTSYGVEGDLILTYSARIIDMLKKGRVEIHIDMIPEKSRKELEVWFSEQIALYSKITVGELLAKYLSDRLLAAMGKITRVHADKPAANLSYLERKALLLWAKDFHVTIKRARPFNETRGVLGGVSTDEIDAESMRSKKIKNLYFAGEVMDVLGPWGGYNIQMAFSTGYLAGLSAAKSLSR